MMCRKNLHDLLIVYHQFEPNLNKAFGRQYSIDRLKQKILSFFLIIVIDDFKFCRRYLSFNNWDLCNADHVM